MPQELGAGGLRVASRHLEGFGEELWWSMPGGVAEEASS